jgi:uncharacterized protein YcbK (DUF882 family)
MAYGSLLTIGSPLLAKAASGRGALHKMLDFQNTHTGDKLKLTYFEHGRYLKDALCEINYVMRDFRTDDTHPIDPSLLDQLYDLKKLLGINKPFHIISGYRSPFTNALLRKSSRGVAKKSLHMQGMAIDVRIPGVDTRVLRNAALALRQGGVGYYRSSDFVHLDSGRFRTW